MYRFSRHQLSTAAWANAMFWSMPHLQAAQRRICFVVPLKLPLIRGAIQRLAWGLSPAKKCFPAWCPVAALNRLFTPLFSAAGLASTQLAHCAAEGSFVPGLRVWK